ncbi:MAG: ParB/RepB/Spo0J family partition protein [Paracoccaceae bacterium]|nr:ParB/RepB/Spo0J family partition protein [Paracoccaceae bacterium]
MAKKSPPKRGLGRGLSALMADADIVSPAAPTADKANSPDLLVPIEKLRPNPDQPRRDFSPEDLDELAASIREKGIIQPLLVRNDPQHPGEYQIVAGERRWRAAQRANLHDIPVLVRELNDTEVIEIAIIENIQRANLNAVEEAMGYRQLMDRFGHTQEKLAEALGKSRSHIANLLRLLTLPEEVLTWLREGKLTAGHARALITAENPTELARKVITKGLSVRQTEALAKNPKVETKERKPKENKAEKDADTRALELDLTASLGMEVRIDHRAGGESGVVSIQYKNLEELDELCQILARTHPA